MQLPFTIGQFLDVFRQYNLTVWPMQIILFLLAVSAIYLVFRKYRYSDKIIIGILAFLWLWIGIVYHILFFSSINKAAYLFGALFIAQAGLFIFTIFRGNLEFRFRKDTYSVIGLIFIAYALIIYYLLNYVFGHGWPANPTFGLPCPTVIFTFGILLLASTKVPKYLLIIPLLWAFLGLSAALSLGIWEDIGLIVAGVLGTILIIIKDSKRKHKK